MSAQSIIEFTKDSTCDKIDDFLIYEGNRFRNIIDYDIDDKINYQEINQILLFKEMLEKTERCEEVLKIINKILI